MLIKKFKAASMPEALKMVKAEFGLDAMILNSREERRKGVLGLFRKPYVEVTASIGKATPERVATNAAPAEAPATTRDEFRNAMLEPLAREIRQLREKVDVLYERGPGDMKSTASLSGKLRQGPDICADASATEQPDEFAAVQWHDGETQDGHLQPGGGKKPAKGKKTALGAFAEELRQNGVDSEIVEPLLEKIASFIGRKSRKADIGKGLEQALESLVGFAAEEQENAGRRVIALVGPTGVGKTTTIAKLALNAAGQGKKVAILSADKLKPGDVEHLRTCAGSADITVDSVLTPQKLGKALNESRERDVILIDTGGISPGDREGMERLEKLLASSPLIEKHLCLSSTTRDKELAETVRRFGRYAIDRLVFTRLDESATFGSIINVLLRSNLPPSFLTAGQKASGEIETATAGRLAALTTGGRES